MRAPSALHGTAVCTALLLSAVAPLFSLSSNWNYISTLFPLGVPRKKSSLRAASRSHICVMSRKWQMATARATCWTTRRTAYHGSRSWCTLGSQRPYKLLFYICFRASYGKFGSALVWRDEQSHARAPRARLHSAPRTVPEARGLDGADHGRQGWRRRLVGPG